MNTDFQIALISNDPYHLGLLKGYCHAHCYKIFETAADMESINAIIQMRPNIVFLAVSQVPKTDLGSMHKMSIDYQIPVCCLRSINNAPGLEEPVADWIDAILDAPLDVNQLDDYLHHRFKHHPCFIQEKRSIARRAANDRRRLMLEQQNAAGSNDKSTNNTFKNGDAECFMLGPFQIDQRSKSVLFNGKSLNLTRKEFELFELLTKDVERVFMTDEIINYLWPENNRATKSDLYQYMHLLRKKIEIDPNNPQWILTVKGFGYKLNVAASAGIHPSGI
jgi:DNA-binding winged helix-turn-helix (wHTH) protein/AmiR/NasT family two-component response regulator